MISILLIAHRPFAGALLQVAAHPDFAEPLPLAALDVAPELKLEAAVAEVRAVVDGLLAGGASGVLVLTDAFGATPCNAARAVAADDGRVRVVAGVNVPMLWRSLSSGRGISLDDAVLRAVSGGQQGVMHVPTPRQHNQPAFPADDAEDRHHDQ